MGKHGRQRLLWTAVIGWYAITGIASLNVHVENRSPFFVTAALFPLVILVFGSCLWLSARYLQNSMWERIRRFSIRFGLYTLPLPILILFLVHVSHNLEQNRVARCKNHLKQLGLVFRMYADDDPQRRYPALSSRPGRLFWEDSTVSNRPLYPDYVTDPSVLVCPEAHTDTLDTWRNDNDPKLEDDHSYFYLGYAIRNQEDFIAFARGYSDQMAGTPDFSADLEHGDGAQPLVRLRSTVDLDAKTKASIPVLIERPGNHASPGGNVLYFNGHADFIDEGTWPYTEEALAVLNELDTQ